MTLNFVCFPHYRGYCALFPIHYPEKKWGGRAMENLAPFRQGHSGNPLNVITTSGRFRMDFFDDWSTKHTTQLQPKKAQRSFLRMIKQETHLTTNLPCFLFAPCTAHNSLCFKMASSSSKKLIEHTEKKTEWSAQRKASYKKPRLTWFLP